MKLGFNSKTGQSWTLTSWLTGDDPSPGAFSLGLDPTGKSQLLAWYRRDAYWNSGVWDGRGFKSVPKLTSDDVRYNFSFVSTEDERYFTYIPKRNSSPPSFWVLNYDGYIYQFKFYDWGVTYQSSSIICPISHSPFPTFEENKKGCLAEQNAPECRRGDQWFHLEVRYVGVSPPYRFVENASLRIDDCDKMCWSNCSCIAYATLYDNATGCQLWSSGSTFRESSNYNDQIFLLRSTGKNKRWIWCTAAAVVATVIILLGIFCCMRRRRIKSKEEKERSQQKLLLELGTNVTTSEDGKKDQDLKLFSLASIILAINNFSSANKLGQGGFGPVYRGKLLEGQEIAVKRLSRSSGQGVEEFKTELALIVKLQHVNLVKLLGCCIEGEEKMLIYEYMPKKSLDSYIFGPVKKELLDWKKRRHIIEGIAHGLLYLHKFSRLRVIHRDLKASNILLDNQLNPKISDFGMARIFGRNESEANTNRVVGTYGYMAPEYAMEGIFSVKSDVYSFGVLLLEIISSKKNTASYLSDRPLNLVGYAWEFRKEDAALKLIDPTLDPSCCRNEFLRCIHVGLLCVQESPGDRPTMSVVVSMLTNQMMPLPEPNQPGFSDRSLAPVDSHSRNLEGVSINHATITVMEGR